MSHHVYLNDQDFDLQLESISIRPQEVGVLMVDPEHYDVVYEINPHMKGMIGCVDRTKAKQQWKHVVKMYRSIGVPVVIISGAEEFPDMVFCANQSFPYLDYDNTPTVIISRMASHYRQGEEVYFDRWYQKQGYRIIRQVEPPVEFEGMGDVLWHPSRKLMYAGYGYRTHKSALQRLANCVGAPVVGFELIDPSFYHLDTALAPINEDSALYVEEAFTPQGVALLKKCFPDLIRVPLQEGKKGFVTNGHCPDQKHFIVHRGNDVAKKALEERGIVVIEVDTSEFMKSGGSVFCMKMMLPMLKK